MNKLIKIKHLKQKLNKIKMLIRLLFLIIKKKLFKKLKIKNLLNF